MSDTDELVRMANQIADFWAAYPQDDAITSIADHIQDFWTPLMRRDLNDYITAGGNRLRPLARLAGQRLAAANIQVESVS